MSDLIIFICREKAEQTIWHRLKQLGSMKRKRCKSQGPLRIGLLGCMAERLKEEILQKEKLVDVLAGPDAYRDLPRLLSVAETGQQAANVLLSLDETYADVMPVQTSSNNVSSFVSIMRGCDNMCTYCIVPFTRGRERSRPVHSILEEVRMLSSQLSDLSCKFIYSLRKLIAVDRSGIKPDWSECTRPEITLVNLIANTLARSLTSVVSKEIGRYESGCVGSFPSLGITTIMASRIDAGNIGGLSTALQNAADKPLMPGVKEVTLLGQNVNSYCDTSSAQFPTSGTSHLSRSFSTIYKPKQGGLRFVDLLDQVSRIDPEMRIRFTSPHPKDFPDEVLYLIRERHNICKQIHIPAQSGSNRVLEAMRRG
ncbi:unnamed protein product [Ranitomeya imitator]|uniref:CDK5 regulatory subunit-associated protein 1 n=1 Tax=Ranitomeya imitator TaxID=111125 RepID=A0ABN9MCZ1_9NEOB|nr:unnamed protein product [Ranitomeya imitator]